jgi:hypothetical protein
MQGHVYTSCSCGPRHLTDRMGLTISYFFKNCWIWNLAGCLNLVLEDLQPCDTGTLCASSTFHLTWRIPVESLEHIKEINQDLWSARQHRVYSETTFFWRMARYDAISWSQTCKLVLVPPFFQREAGGCTETQAHPCHFNSIIRSGSYHFDFRRKKSKCWVLQESSPHCLLARID